jgi:hypothetical protein
MTVLSRVAATDDVETPESTCNRHVDLASVNLLRVTISYDQNVFHAHRLKETELALFHTYRMGTDSIVDDVKRLACKTIKHACGDKNWVVDAVFMEDLRMERFIEGKYKVASKDDFVLVKPSTVDVPPLDIDEEHPFSFRVTMSDRSNGRKGVDTKVEKAMAEENLMQAKKKVNEQKVQAAKDMQRQLALVKSELKDCNCEVEQLRIQNEACRAMNADFIAQHSESECFLAFKKLVFETGKVLCRRE